MSYGREQPARGGPTWTCHCLSLTGVERSVQPRSTGRRFFSLSRRVAALVQRSTCLLRSVRCGFGRSCTVLRPSENAVFGFGSLFLQHAGWGESVSRHACAPRALGRGSELFNSASRQRRTRFLYICRGFRSQSNRVLIHSGSGPPYSNCSSWFFRRAASPLSLGRCAGAGSTSSSGSWTCSSFGHAGVGIRARHHKFQRGGDPTGPWVDVRLMLTLSEGTWPQRPMLPRSR